MGSETGPGLLKECNTPIKASQESMSWSWSQGALTTGQSHLN